jgi:hypothetical protein
MAFIGKATFDRKEACFIDSPYIAVRGTPYITIDRQLRIG